MSLAEREILALAQAMADTLPALGRVDACTVVVKYGGNAMTDENLKRGFATDVAMLKRLGARPIIVHGGGPQIGQGLSALDKPSVFVRGMRVTDKEAVSVVDRVLGTDVNGEITGLINAVGGHAVGLNGRVDGLIKAKKLVLSADEHGEVPDLGYVGEVAGVETSMIEAILSRQQIPVIAPLGLGADDEIYNINADLVAGCIAGTMQAQMLILLTNTAGLLDANGVLLRHLSLVDSERLIDDGTVHGGMLPKIDCAMNAVRQGVRYVRIADGRVAHCLVLEVLGEHGTGTTISERG